MTDVMGLRVTLISPPMVASHASGFYVGRRGGPPINLAYLARVIRDCGLEYDIIDCMAHDTPAPSTLEGFPIEGLPLDEAVSRIHPDTRIVGITSMFTSEWMVVRELAARIKRRLPGVTILIGGEHATADTDNILTYEDAIDFVFLGESEESLACFLRAFPEGRHRETPGIAWRGPDGRVVHTPRQQRMTRIDDLLPLWDKIDVDYYLDRGLSFSQMGKRSIPIVSTRGCPYKCTFCTNERMWGVRYVMRSPEAIVREMREHVMRRRVEHFDFVDLATSVNKRWFHELLNAMIRDLPGISWEMTVGTRAEILDHETLDLVRRSGNRTMGYAPETGSLSMARKIRKKLDYPKFYESVRAAVALGFDVKANVIIGFPDETLRELAATIWMSLRLGWMGVKGVTILKFMPFRGTVLGEPEFSAVWPTRGEYERATRAQLGVEGVKVLSLRELLSNPRDQLYAGLSNFTMVASYLLCAIRRPRTLRDLAVNIWRGQPSCAVEVAIFTLLWRFRRQVRARPPSPEPSRT